MDSNNTNSDNSNNYLNKMSFQFEGEDHSQKEEAKEEPTLKDDQMFGQNPKSALSSIIERPSELIQTDPKVLMSYH